MQPQPENNLVYFLTILEAAGKLDLYSKEFSDAKTFFQASNQLNFNASLLLVATIGEQVAKISNTTKEKYGNVQWQNIKGMRNRIVHDYRGIDFEITFDIVTKEVPVLQHQLEEIVKAEMTEGIILREELAIAQNNPLWYRHIDFNALGL